MPLSPAQLLDIAARAATLSERLQAAATSDFRPPPSAALEKRLGNWQQAAASGDLEKWRRRLKWDGYDETIARRAAAPQFRFEPAQLPDWARVLERILARPAPFRPAKNASREPFAEVFEPFVFEAERDFEFGFDWNSSARIDLKNALLRRLATLAAPTLDLEWNIARTLAKIPADPNSNVFYNRFCEQLLSGGWEKIALEYPVLVRQMVAICAQWRETVAEFAARLKADLAELETHFGLALGARIARISAHQSDPHAGGRSVWIVEWETGQKLVYKPKNPGAETGCFRFLKSLNALGAPLRFRTPRFVARAEHAWFEFIAAAPLSNREAAPLLYRRAGALLCALHLLDATDCHGENLVASGDFPILIDAEAPFSPRASGLEPQNAMMQAARQLDESVLRTGMLPQWEAGPDVRGSYDISGLGCAGQHGPQGATRRFTKWKNLSTDALGRGEIWESPPSMPGAPFLTNSPEIIEPGDYAAEIEAGFAQTHAFLRKHRAQILGDGGLLDSLSQESVRWIFRATGVYGALLEQARRPHFLRDGFEHGARLEAICRTFLSADEAQSRALWPLQSAEMRALDQCDIPLFRARAQSADLVVGDATLERVFEAAPLDLARARFEKWDAAHLQAQSEIIREVFRARRAGKNELVAAPRLAENLDSQDGDFAPFIARFAEEIARRAVRFGDEAAWIATGFSARTERYQLQPVGSGFYEGNAGIALFLAAFWRQNGNANALNLGRAAMRAAVNSFFPNRVNLGLAEGVGGMAFSLCHFAALTGENRWFERASEVLESITPEIVEADAQLDVLGGAAGALLAFLALPPQFRGRNWEKTARECGAHLQNRRVNAGGRDWNGAERVGAAWPTLDGRLLSGFSHGAAGIALALLRGAREFDENGWETTAVEAAAWERAQFDLGNQNWPDLRFGDHAHFTPSWCHGAPGIALARGAARPFDAGEKRNWDTDISTAATATLAAPSSEIDHLCCGNLGRAVALCAAGEQQKNADWQVAARRSTAQVLGREGGLRWLPGVEAGAFCPGFFNGIAGAGYALLWMDNPEVLPELWSFPGVES